jgi:hypothetical protein
MLNGPVERKYGLPGRHRWRADAEWRRRTEGLRRQSLRPEDFQD